MRYLHIILTFFIVLFFFFSPVHANQGRVGQSPETFHLPPGSYDIKIKPMEKEIPEFWKQNVMITAGERTQTTVDITNQNR